MFPPNAMQPEQAAIDQPVESGTDRVTEKLKRLDKERSEKRILHSSLSFLADSQSAFGKILDEQLQPGAEQCGPNSKENIPNNPSNAFCNCALSQTQAEMIQKLSNELSVVREELEQRKKSDVMSKELFQQSLKMSLDKSVASYFELEGKLLDANRQLRIVLEEKETIFELYQNEKQISHSLTQRIDELVGRTDRVHDIEQQNVRLLDENLILRQELLFLQATSTRIPNERDEFYECNQEDAAQNPFSSSFYTPCKPDFDFPEVEDVTDQAEAATHFYTPKTSMKPRQTLIDFTQSNQETIGTPSHNPFYATPLRFAESTPFESPVSLIQSTKKKVSFNDNHQVVIMEEPSLFMEEMPLEIANEQMLLVEVKRLQTLLCEKEETINELAQQLDNFEKQRNDNTESTTVNESKIAKPADSCSEHQKSLEKLQEKLSTTELQLDDKSKRLSNLFAYLEIKNEIESELMKFAEKFADFFDAIDIERMNLIKRHQNTCSFKLRTTNCLLEPSEKVVNFLVESLRGKVNVLELEISRLHEQLNSQPLLEAQFERSNATVDSLISTVNTLRIEDQISKNDYEEIQQKYSTLSNEFMDLQATLLENEQVIVLLKDQATQLQEEISNLQEMVVSKDNKIVEMELESSKTKLLYSQSLACNKRMGDENIELKRMQSELAKETHRLTSEYLVLVEEREKLGNECHKLKAQYDDLKIQSDKNSERLNHELTNAQQQVITLREDNEILHEKIRTQMDELKKSEGNMDTFKMYEEKIAQFEQLFAICDNFEQENDVLQSELEVLKTEHQDMLHELADQNDKLQMLQQVNIDLQKQIESLTKNKADSLEQLDVANRTTDDTGGNLTTNTNSTDRAVENDKLSNQLMVLREDNCKLREQLDILSSENKKLADQNHILRRNVDDLAHEIECLGREAQQTEVVSNADELRQMKTSNLSLKTENDKLHRELVAILEENTEFKAKTESLLAEMENITNLLHTCRKSLQETEQSYKNVLSENENLEANAKIDSTHLLHLQGELEEMGLAYDELHGTNEALVAQLEAQNQILYANINSVSVTDSQWKNNLEVLKMSLRKSSHEFMATVMLQMHSLKDKLAILEDKLSLCNSHSNGALHSLCVELEQLKAHHSNAIEICQQKISDNQMLNENLEYLDNEQKLLKERNDYLESEYKDLLDKFDYICDENKMLGEKLDSLEMEQRIDQKLCYFDRNPQSMAENRDSLAVDEATFAYEQQLDRLQDETGKRLQMKETEIQSLSETVQVVREQFDRQKEQFKRYKLAKDKQISALKVEISNMKHAVASLKESLSNAGEKITKYRRKLVTDQSRIKDLIFQKTYLSSIAREYRECEKTMARIINGVSRTDQKPRVVKFNRFRSVAFAILSLVKLKGNLTK